MNKKFDSDEEEFFNFWCEEAVENNIIIDFKYTQKEYILSEKFNDTRDKFLLHPHKYTEDFLVYGINHKFYKPMKKFFRAVNGNCYHIDTKGTFNKYGGDREFSINRKWMMDKHGIFINKIVPDKLFKQTWAPECYLKYTEKTKVVQKKYLEMKTVKQFMEGIK